jgi:hypothetical protein
MHLIREVSNAYQPLLKPIECLAGPRASNYTATDLVLHPSKPMAFEAGLSGMKGILLGVYIEQCPNI